MGGVGFTEILLLAVIALIVVGPQRLPKIARTAGKLTRQARNAWQGLQSELQAEMDLEHNREIMNKAAESQNGPSTDSKDNSKPDTPSQPDAPTASKSESSSESQAEPPSPSSDASEDSSQAADEPARH